MNKSQKKKIKSPKDVKITRRPEPVSQRPPSLSFFDRCDVFFNRYERIWFWIIFGITLLTSVLLYDPRVSPGGDDSNYILVAHDFLKEFKFPNFQGPLYPIALSLVDVIFGMSLKAFKIFSMLCILACMYFMYRTFRNRIPSMLLFITLLFTSFNSHVLYFASQTYSEAFYMFMQSLLMFVFSTFFVSRENQHEKHTVFAELKRHILLAVVLLGVIMTRSAGYSLFIAVLGYFILYRQWKNIGWTIVCFVICLVLYQGLKYILWGELSLQGSGHGAALMNKNYYRPEDGREDLAGFIVRLWINSNQYLSRFFMIMLGLRDTYTAEGYFVPLKPVITILIYLLGLTGLWFSYKQNRYLFFSGVFAGIFLIISFVILQTNWNQYRMIVPAFPVMILLLFSGVYYLLSLPKLRSFQFLLLIPTVIIFFYTLSDTSEATQKAGKIKNEYSGLTPDWLHYAQASAWAGGNLPEDAFVACRKHSISMIYGKGKKFYPVYFVKSGNFNAFYERWRADSLTYSMLTYEGRNEQIYKALIGKIEGRVFLDDKSFFVVQDREFTQKLFQQYKDIIAFSPSEYSHLEKQARTKSSIYYPDSLLAPMRRANVTHLLTANLRLNPNIKDGQIINTVERMAYFIQEKYPTIFHSLIQFGAPDDEPAEIYQINWNILKD